MHQVNTTGVLQEIQMLVDCRIIYLGNKKGGKPCTGDLWLSSTKHGSSHRHMNMAHESSHGLFFAKHFDEGPKNQRMLSKCDTYLEDMTAKCR